MRERIIRVLDDKTTKSGIHLQIVETEYDCGTHYVLLTNGEPGFHSVDYDRVKRDMDSFFR